ncbi:hypothetical protein MMC07_007317 [Pseudocyphellaria aurata]|nr:hypothetical protein [Pseudocyphellaria aurata]
MVNEKQSNHAPEDSLPIPTYEEAITSRSSSSRNFLGPSDISHDAERQGLLGSRRSFENDFDAPSENSTRSSLDILPLSGRISPESSTDGLHREMIQLEVQDSDANVDLGRARGSRFSKHFTNLTHSLSSINLPFRQWLPSSDYIRARMLHFPEQLRPNWILVGRIFALLLVLSLAYLLFVSDIFNVGRERGDGETYNPEAVRSYVQGHIDETYIRQNSEHLTMFDHMAGTEGSFVLAKWVEGLFNAAKLERVRLERFDVYLNYPKEGGRRVAIVEPADMAWEALIEEKSAYSDPAREQTLVFHGHSRAGNVTGPLVYANYGSREDFKRLKDQGVDLKGSIAIVRYHGTQGDRALKVKAAEMAGSVGCIIYSDPADDGFRLGKVYPDGRYMPSDGVQRGAVSLMSWVVGDVLSSGFASLPGARIRNSKVSNPGLTSIPSIPLAWRDAQKLLQAVTGHGQKVPDSWKGGIEDVEWWTGDQSSPIVHLMNFQDEEERQPIYNVVGKITGLEQPEKSVIVGNHRDAWCFGATDPGSGTAVLLEVVRIFGELRRLGWRPLRSIEFASWDGEEYNLIGSTEHVEARLDDIRQNGIAYLNVESAVSGTEFKAAASPLFEKALLQVLDRTTDPVANKTLRSIWNEKKSKLQGLGAGSDYVAFQDLAGTSSIDISFGGPPYPYHSCYDNFEWMRKYGDTDFKYHKTLAQIWALLILEMADTRLLPFDFNAYARAVRGYVEDLDLYAQTKGATKQNFVLKPLYQAVAEFAKNANDFHEWDPTWAEVFYAQGEVESNVMAIKRMSHNTRMANFETNLLDVDGGVGGGLSLARYPELIARLTDIIATRSGTV